MGGKDKDFISDPDIKELGDWEILKLAEQFEDTDITEDDPIDLKSLDFSIDSEDDSFFSTPKKRSDKAGKKSKKAAMQKNQEPEDATISCMMLKGNRHIFKKVSNPEKLQAEIKTWPFRDGDCYHVETIANVDSFTWLRVFIGLQKAKYVAVSTWALFGDAVQWIMNAQKVGRIGRIDFFIGDNIQVRHPDAYKVMKKLLPECGGRLVIFKNHSKVIAIEGERFDCVIESSANINVNLIPHFENTCITVGRDFLRHTVNTFSTVRPTNANTFSEPYFIDSQEETK